MDHFDTIVVGAGVAGLTAARLLTRAGRARPGARGPRPRGRPSRHRPPLRTRHRPRCILDPRHHRLPRRRRGRGIRHAHGRVHRRRLPARQPPDRLLRSRRTNDSRMPPHRAFIDDIHAADATLLRSRRGLGPGCLLPRRHRRSDRPPGLGRERAQRVREYLEHRSEEQYGAWIEDLAAHGLDDDSIDGDEVVFPDGYDRLPSHLAEGLDVRLTHVVDARAMVARRRRRDDRLRHRHRRHRRDHGAGRRTSVRRLRHRAAAARARRRRARAG